MTATHTHTIERNPLMSRHLPTGRKRRNGDLLLFGVLAVAVVIIVVIETWWQLS
jgi:hypothetical protein